MPILKPTRGIQLNRTHPLARGLVGCWLFNENTGGKVFDLSRNGHIGTFDSTYTPIWSISKFGSAINFSPVQRVNLGSSTHFSLTDEITCVSWIKTTSLARQFIISARFMNWEFGVDDPRFYVGYGDGTNYDLFYDTGFTAQDKWQQYAAAIKKSTGVGYLYIDGKLVATGSGDALPGCSASPDVFIGARVTSNPFDGQIDHVMIFNRDLTAAEVAQLYREPFCMFEHGLSLAVLYVPVGGVVELAGSIFAQSTASATAEVNRRLSGSISVSSTTTATAKISKKVSASSVSATELVASLSIRRNFAAELQGSANLFGSLTLAGEVGLAGTISAALSLTGKLSLVTAGKWFTGSLKTERKWLIDALFPGMTANAFKLGTVLSCGWFWMRRLECSVLYRGLSMDTVDFANILTMAEHNDNTISPPDYISHDAGSSYFYVVRRFNSCGYQECTLTAAVKVAIDVDGKLIKPQPNKLFTCVVSQISGNKAQLLWFYCPIEQKSQPAHFNIYCDNKTGQINYQESLTTISYQGRWFYSFSSDMFEDGKYLFAVRPVDAEQVENDSLARISIQIATTSSNAISILDVETD